MSQTPVPMPRLVMKFGGTSVATVERIHNVARHVKREIAAGYDVAVVVSAMSGKTNELVAWCKEAAPLHDMREYDAVVASGEQVTSGLLAIALQAQGVPARSWQGWQIPLLTGPAHGSARIEAIEPAGILEGFARGETAVIAGFQGHAQANGPHHDARARRLRHQRRGRRGGDRGRALRYLHRRRRRLHDGPARGLQGAPHGPNRLRGDARDGVARGQGHAGALGRAGLEARHADLCALVFRRSGAIRGRARSSAGRRTSWNRKS